MRTEVLYCRLEVIELREADRDQLYQRLEHVETSRNSVKDESKERYGHVYSHELSSRASQHV
jgi:hypothetical protein